ncbi:MAG: hypothetical protein Q8Q39_01230 [bacterium]|nr:hypothetical protein [bacterium]
MQIEVKNSAGILLAKMELAPKGELRFLDTPDQEFVQFIETALRRGITQKQEIRDRRTRKRIMVTKAISRTDPLFSLAFREFLDDAGYDVISKHPEIEKEIRELLTEYPDDEQKEDTLTRLENMSYLEQTTVLEALRIMKGT